MAKRLNDTKAVAAMPALKGDYEGNRYQSHSKIPRRIENGFVTSETHHDGDSFKSVERFHETPEPTAERHCEGSLARAKAHLNQ